MRLPVAIMTLEALRVLAWGFPPIINPGDMMAFAEELQNFVANDPIGQIDSGAKDFDIKKHLQTILGSDEEIRLEALLDIDPKPILESIGILDKIQPIQAEAGPKDKDKAIKGAVWVADTPRSAACIVIVVGPLVIVVYPNTVATSPLRAILGIGILGPVVGVAQSVIGNVLAGSLFALLQNTGMGGTGLAKFLSMAPATGLGVSIVIVTDDSSVKI
ncbi:hypothetical protein VTJ04DRAFT_5637 [Mycothermus thermophilus]|uniref:uncharacterized protein n=1 Tax=Humicola insolens TaxID=85995 RepID=UPI0037422D31